MKYWDSGSSPFDVAHDTCLSPAHHTAADTPLVEALQLGSELLGHVATTSLNDRSFGWEVKILKIPLVPYKKLEG